MDQVNADNTDILADWLEDEYPDALAGFKKDPITVGFIHPRRRQGIGRDRGDLDGFGRVW